MAEKKLKIRLGQVWKKKDIGTLWLLTGRRHGNWAMKKIGNSGAGKPHAIKDHDLLKFYEIYTRNNSKASDGN